MFRKEYFRMGLVSYDFGDMRLPFEYQLDCAKILGEIPDPFFTEGVTPTAIVEQEKKRREEKEKAKKRTDKPELRMTLPMRAKKTENDPDQRAAKRSKGVEEERSLSHYHPRIRTRRVHVFKSQTS
ncbi:hypothetical protein T439DRAFT_141474 [Meredithblackwellia eburnea MCA 4105]